LIAGTTVLSVIMQKWYRWQNTKPVLELED
jgi:hypothetical protein